MDDELFGIEEEFRKSWDKMEWWLENFQTIAEPQHPMVLVFNELRSLAYDEWFRAGQSLDTFIISRSHRHGLRLGQPRIEFYMDGDDIFWANAIIARECYSLKLTEAKINTELKALLELLMAQPID